MNIKQINFGYYFRIIFIFLILAALFNPTTSSKNIIQNEVEDPVLSGEQLEDAIPNVAIILDFSQSMQTLAEIEIGTWTVPSPWNQDIHYKRSKWVDIALSALFDILDADDSIKNINCEDPNMLFDGENQIISCNDFLHTPLRNIEPIVAGRENLPIVGSPDLLSNQLTDNDANILGANLLPMNFVDTPRICTYDQSPFQMDNLGFMGKTAASIQRVWDYYKTIFADGWTPLGYILGYDNALPEDPNNIIINDALHAFDEELKADPAVDCRPQFVILITDGFDTCTRGLDWNDLGYPSQRASIKAVNNLRTFFSRANNGSGVSNSELNTNVRKEILTFIIGMNINSTRTKKVLNTMALAGGTHTKGIIRHVDPATNSLYGSVNIYDDDILPGDENDEFEVYRQIARADGISTDPEKAQIRGCGINDVPITDGDFDIDEATEEEIENFRNQKCTFRLNGVSDTDVFTNHYINPEHWDGNETSLDLDGFAFFPNTPDEFKDALEKVFSNINSFTTTGVAPSAPQTAGNVTLRDRVFLALTNPIVDESLWSGRLALYSFVNDPNVEGRKLIARKPSGSENYTTTADLEQYSIFNDDGTLHEQNAIEYHWEAGGILAKRASDSRNIYTVNTSGNFNIDISASGVIRYTGDREIFHKDTQTITPETFGISDEDVTSLSVFPPPVCGDCSNDCSYVEEDNIDESSSDDCINCIKDCYRDRIIDFVSGNTGIVPIAKIGDILPHICSDNNNDNETPDEVCSVKLGDIFHSSPRTVASPSVLFFDTGFQIYTKAFRQRSAVVYAGANDGGLHAFHAGELVNPSGTSTRNPFTGRMESLPFYDEGNGSEMFFYIPPTFLPDAISVHDPHNHFEGTIEELDFNPDYRFGDLKNFVLGLPQHRSFFDGTVTIADVFIDGFDNGISTGQNGLCDLDDTDPGVAAEVDGLVSHCGKEWHTVLISGFRNGGGGLTALDITNAHCDNPVADQTCGISKFTGESGSIFSGDSPDFPMHLWSLFDRDFGNTWSNPKVARIRLKAGSGDDEIFADRWVAFVGGGVDPNPVSGQLPVYGNAFYAIDIATGQIIYKFHWDRSVPDDLGTQQEALSVEMKCELASDPGVFDINADGYSDLVYIGDTCGRLWRFDVSQPIETDAVIAHTGLELVQGGSLDRGSAVIEAPNWHASIAFCANENNSECRNNNSLRVPDNDVEPIFFPPTSVIDNIGRRHVIFQTGNRRNPTQIVEFNPGGNPRNGTHNAGKLYNFIDTYIPSFLAGSLQASEASDRGMLTNGDIVMTVTLTQVGNSDLFNSSITAPQNITTGSGEYIVEYPNNAAETYAGEKGTGTPWVINGVLVFITYAPTPLNEILPCEPAFGNTRVFALDFMTGLPQADKIEGLKAINQNISETTAGIDLGSGISSGANLSFGSKNSIILSVSTTGDEDGASFVTWEQQIASQTQTLFWEEVM